MENDENPEDRFFLTHKVLDKLALKYREVLILRFMEKMSYEEISDVLKIPEGTVAIRINRAKKMFVKIAEKENISFTG
jgi:RNA polymerase sigma-70 factor (ECF subfamily)